MKTTRVITWRPQTDELRQARDVLHTIGQEPLSLDAYMAVNALYCIDAVSPEYEPPRHVDGEATLARARTLLEHAVGTSESTGEVWRLAEALDLIGDR